jgi:hypothetical protein
MTKRRFGQSATTVLQFAMLAVIGFLTAGPAAQGLGDVAKREAERRQKVATGKRYTNNDLPPDSGSAAPIALKATPTTSEQTVKPEVSADGAASQAGSKTPEPAATGPQKDNRPESYWRDKANEIRRHLQTYRDQVKALEGRLSDLDSQPATPAGASEREVTLKSLQQSQKNLGFLENQWRSFEAKARASKVSPAWIQ